MCEGPLGKWEIRVAVSTPVSCFSGRLHPVLPFVPKQSRTVENTFPAQLKEEQVLGYKDNFLKSRASWSSSLGLSGL